MLTVADAIHRLRIRAHEQHKSGNYATAHDLNSALELLVRLDRELMFYRGRRAAKPAAEEQVEKQT